jgi:3-mercaptopyruvate sulfurtransferase SseA
VALWLKRRGIERVLILTGGLQAWIDQGFPVEDRDNLPAEGISLDL